MTIKDVMNQERAGLLGESLVRDPILGEAPMPYVAVTESSVLVRTPTVVKSIHPVTLGTLAGRDSRMAFIQAYASLKYKFLWVHADNNDYRHDYTTFLREVHKISDDLPKNLHVDHLYNRQRAKQMQTPFIRLVLAPQAINTSHGAGYEESRSRNGIGRVGRDHTMDLVTLMKVCGVPSPRKGQPLTAEMIAHVHDVAQLYGMDVTEVKAAIKDLMDVAAFERGT